MSTAPTTHNAALKPPTPLPAISCARCGVIWRRGWPNGPLCSNCCDRTSGRPHRHIPLCPLCLQQDVPSELHHVAGERHCSWLVLRVCLNCHMQLTYRQVCAWPASWRETGRQEMTVRAIGQGVYDVLALWWTQSGAATFAGLRSGAFDAPTWRSLWLTIPEFWRVVSLACRALAQTIGFVAWNAEG